MFDFSGLFSKGLSFVPYLFYGVILIGGVFVGAFAIKRKRYWTNDITIHREREGGGSEELESKCRIGNDKQNALVFLIKRGRKKLVSYVLPKLEGMTSKGRFFYYQINPLTYIQLRKKIESVADEEKREYLMEKYNEFKNETEFTQIINKIDKKVQVLQPIESDIKYGAVLELKNIANMTRPEKSTLDKVLMPATFITMFILMFLFVYVLIQKFNPSVLLEVSKNLKIASQALSGLK